MELTKLPKDIFLEIIAEQNKFYIFKWRKVLSIFNKLIEQKRKFFKKLI